MTGQCRRIFLKRVALASAGAAAASALPGALLGESLGSPLAGASRDWLRAPCTLCDVGCGLLVAVEKGRAVAVRGDPDSPVSRGLLCVKGYHSIQALYATDRLTRALVRRDGRLVPVPMPEALDLVARQLRETVQEHGKNSVAVYGSGQWSIPAGYVASKLFKGGIGTNNVEASTRLGSASAAAGLRTSFGREDPVGCYEDIDHADVFVLWDANMAEEHPVLFSRMLERRRKSKAVRIIDLSTRTTRTSYAADRALIFAPGAEPAIANAICQELVARKLADRDFLRDHVAFKKGRTGIGYGLEEEGPFTDEVADADWGEYVDFLAAYSPEKAEGVAGLAAAEIRWLASLYGDRSRRVMSLWGAGVNKHARGTWTNNLLHNIHLLVGKIAEPGDGFLSLADEASALGTVREVGLSTEALPRGVVTSQEDRELAERIWGVPAGTIQPRPTHHAISMFRALDRGDIRFMWIQGADPMATLPNLSRYRAAARKQGRFIVVSDSYPSATTDVADVVLPTALWIEQEGLFGNPERRTQHFGQMVRPPGEAMSETWQIIEVGRRLGLGKLFPWAQADVVEEIWTEYARFRGTLEGQLAPLEELKARPGIMWPYVDGRETRWRYSAAHDPAADGARGAFDFYGNPDHRAWIWLRPYEPPPEQPDSEFPFWLTAGELLEHSGSGSLTRRIPALHRAIPHAYVEMNKEDATALGIRDGDTVRLVSRRGALEIQVRLDYRAQPARGRLFVPAFDESLPVGKLLLDAYCPLSGQPERKCAVRVERIGEGRGDGP